MGTNGNDSLLHFWNSIVARFLLKIFVIFVPSSVNPDDLVEWKICLLSKSVSVVTVHSYFVNWTSRKKVPGHLDYFWHSANQFFNAFETFSLVSPQLQYNCANYSITNGLLPHINLKHFIFSDQFYNFQATYTANTRIALTKLFHPHHVTWQQKICCQFFSPNCLEKSFKLRKYWGRRNSSWSLAMFLHTRSMSDDSW